MVVTIQNLFSESRDILKTLINTNVVDPKTGSANSKRRWMYREFPDTTSRDFGGYPFIVIKSPELNSDEQQDLKGCLTNGDLNITIEIYAEFDDVNARVDTISNGVYATLRTYANRESLLSNNFDLGNITASPFDNQTEDNKKVSTRSFLIPFNSTLEG
jgi:hypothetical protein